MRLDLGFATEDFQRVAANVEEWLGVRLESDDDLELGGHYVKYFPPSLPEEGLCGVRIRQNHVEGRGWRLPLHREMPLCAEVEVCGPEVIQLGRMAGRLRSVGGARASIAAYVVAHSPYRPDDEVFPRAHVVQFDADGVPMNDAPELACHIVFGFGTPDLADAGSIASEILELHPVEHTSEDLGGHFLELKGSDRSGLVRRNKISPVHWLYPRHKHHELLFDVDLRTPNLLELGELVRKVGTGPSIPPTLIEYRVVGDLVRDRIPRFHRYEFP